VRRKEDDFSKKQFKSKSKTTKEGRKLCAKVNIYSPRRIIGWTV
jgi:hypothetical protein